MANFDLDYDVAPAQTNRTSRGPSIASMRTALNGFNATSYSTFRLDAMAENDMVYACKLHGLTPAGL